MARITAEDCKKVIPNCFELVLLASYRAKELSRGAKPSLEKDNDKNAVIALREISHKTLNADNLKSLYVQSFSKKAALDTISNNEHEETEEIFEEEGDLLHGGEAIEVDNFLFEDEEEIDAQD